MKKLYIIFLPIIFFLLAAFSLSASGAANSGFVNNLQTTGEGSGYPVAAAANPENFLAKMFGTIFSPLMFGVLATIILIYGGFTLMMARGDEQKVEKAKTIIVNTIFAIIVMFSGYAILKLIIPLWKIVTR